MAKRQMIFEGKKKAEAESAKVYSCDSCANRKSPLCELCTSVTSPDGSMSKPKYYVEFCSALPMGVTRRLRGRGAACAYILEKYLYAGWPLPVGIVMEYNGHVEKQREENSK
jgi:hypothetical protein